IVGLEKRPGPREPPAMTGNGSLECAPKHWQSLTRSSNPCRSCGGIFDWDKAQIRLKDLNAIAEEPGLWDNPQRAQKLLRERQHLDSALTAYSGLDARLNDATGLIELGEEEHDEEVVKEAEASLAALRIEVQRREVEALLSGEADGNDTFLEVHA